MGALHGAVTVQIPPSIQRLRVPSFYPSQNTSGLPGGHKDMVWALLKRCPCWLLLFPCWEHHFAEWPANQAYCPEFNVIFDETLSAIIVFAPSTYEACLQELMHSKGTRLYKDPYQQDAQYFFPTSTATPSLGPADPTMHNNPQALTATTPSRLY